MAIAAWTLSALGTPIWKTQSIRTFCLKTPRSHAIQQPSIWMSLLKRMDPASHFLKETIPPRWRALTPQTGKMNKNWPSKFLMKTTLAATIFRAMRSSTWLSSRWPSRISLHGPWSGRHPKSPNLSRGRWTIRWRCQQKHQSCREGSRF